jgi:predicted phage terminase large subunit-like protein
MAMAATRDLIAVLLQRKQRRLSLRDFVRLAWAVVEPATPFKSNWHIDALADHLAAVTAGQIRKLVINVPPRCTKSTVVSVLWPCWEWTIRPETKWLFTSYSLNLTKRDSLRCRRLIESVWYRERWGLMLAEDQSEKLLFENSRGGYRMSASVGSSVTGSGGDRLVCDDPHNIGEVESDTMRQGVIDWFDGVLSTRMNDPKQSTITIIGQRAHESDLSGHVLRQGGWEHLCLPLEWERYPFLDLGAKLTPEGKRVTAIGWSDPRSEEGELLWPDHFGEAEVGQLKRSLGSYRVAGQLQQRPSPAEGGLFKAHWWRFWHRPGNPLPAVSVRLAADGSVFNRPCVPLPEKFDRQLLSFDLTFKDTKTSDYAVGQCWGCLDADRFLLDEWRARADFVAQRAAITMMAARWPEATEILIEDSANGSAAVSELQHSISGIKAIPAKGAKEVRAAACTPMIESGNCYLPHPNLAAWVTGFLDEVAGFPNAKNDDRIDAMSQCLNHARQGRWRFLMV